MAQGQFHRKQYKLMGNNYYTLTTTPKHLLSQVTLIKTASPIVIH